MPPRPLPSPAAPSLSWLRAGMVAAGLVLAATGVRAAEPAAAPAAVGTSPGTGISATAPRVVVSIKPLHALAASLMRGVGQPYLLVRGSDNPHSFTLRPSDASVLARADLVLWMGGTVEPSLVKPLTTLPDHARVLSLLTVPGIRVLHARAAGLWNEEAAGEIGGETGGESRTGDGEAAHAFDGHTGGPDGHVWLDPDNARAMATAMAAALTAADPADGPRYQANLTALLAELDALDRDLDAQLAPVRHRPFIVYHDAFQYLEAHYHLNGIGALTISPDVRPGAGRLAQLRERVRALGSVCVFAEPPFEPRQVNALVAGTAARQGVLDPEGVALTPGPGLYADLMRGNVQALVRCLKGATP